MQFYLGSEEDSDCETNEWENQQIRKGVTGAQLVNAQHESVLSRFMIKSNADRAIEAASDTKSTSSLLEQAYAKCTLERPQQMLQPSKPKKDKTKTAALRTPQEIRESINERLKKLKELNVNHLDDIDRMNVEMKAMQLEEMDCKQKAPTVAAKYRFYQELKCYITDLIDCLNEKVRKCKFKNALYFFINMVIKHVEYFCIRNPANAVYDSNSFESNQLIPFKLENC